MIGLGNDIQSIPEFKRARALHEPDTVLTKREWRYCHSAECPEQSMAGLFAAKEALFKALPQKLRCFWTDIEIVHGAHGQPCFALSGALAEWFDSRGLRALVSISHSGEYAHAVALVTAEPLT